jgi:hypothetical protein
VSVIPSMQKILSSSESVEGHLRALLKSWQGLIRHNPECLEWVAKVIKTFEASALREMPAGASSSSGYINSPGGADASDDSARFGALGYAVQGLEIASGHSYRYFGEGRTAMHCLGRAWGVRTPTIPVGSQEIDLRNMSSESLLADIGEHLERMTQQCKKGISNFAKVELLTTKMIAATEGGSGSEKGAEGVVKAALEFAGPVSMSFAALNGTVRRVVILSNRQWAPQTRPFTSADGRTIPTHEVAVNWNSPWDSDPELGTREF